MKVQGTQADAWAAVFVGWLGKKSEIETELMAGVREANLDDVEVDRTHVMFPGSILVGGNLRSHEHIVFLKHLPDGARATVAVRIEKQGKNDLGVSWRLFEYNWLTVFLQNLFSYIMWGLAVGSLLIGLLSSDTGNKVSGFFFAAAFFAVGFWWFMKMLDRREREGTLNTRQKMETRMFLVAVDGILMKCLGDMLVDEDEGKVIVSAQSEGVGRLFGV